MPTSVKGLVLYDKNKEKFTIILNCLFDFATLRKTLRHELLHIFRNDFLSIKRASQIEFETHLGVNMKKTLLSLIIFLIMATAAHATATAEIQNCDVKTYKDFIVRKYMTNGFRVQFPNEYSLVASKTLDSKAAVLLLRMTGGIRLNNNVEYQTNYNFIQNGSNILVQLTLSAITDGGTGVQRVVPMNTNQEINELNAINAEFIGNLNNDKK